MSPGARVWLTLVVQPSFSLVEVCMSPGARVWLTLVVQPVFQRFTCLLEPEFG